MEINIEKFLKGMELLLKQKEISKERGIEILEEIFELALSRPRSFKEGVEGYKVKAKLDVESKELTVKKIFNVVNEIDPELENQQVLEGTPRANGKQNGEVIEELINLNTLDERQIAKVKQLLLQKTREEEKNSFYDQYKNKKGQIVTARVHQINDNYLVLTIPNSLVSIFVPKTNLLPNDSFDLNELINVYVLDINKNAKDIQIVGSRTTPNFIIKLLERDIDDVSDDIVTIEAISREPGVKTKIAVKSSVLEVDPIGSIIGVRGSRIKPIIDELNGERIDVFKYDEDKIELLKNAFYPIILKKIAFNEENTLVSIIIEEEDFLQAIGRRGVNVKLISRLLEMKVDIKPEGQPINESLVYEDVVYNMQEKTNKVENKIEVKKISLEDIVDEKDIEDLNKDVMSTISEMTNFENEQEAKEEDIVKEATQNQDDYVDEIMNESQIDEIITNNNESELLDEQSDEEDIFNDEYDEFDE